MNIVKRTYDWVLSWSESRYGELALFLLAFSESVFFPIPPDVLLIALAIGLPARSFRFALTCTIASVTGAMLGYALGHFVWLNSDGSFTGFANFFFNNIPGFTLSVYEKIKAVYNEWDFWVVFTAGFTPIPYKVITITAGVFELNFLMFLLASIISRGARFFLVAWLIWKYGPNIKNFIDKHFNWLAIAFTVLLIGGFVVFKYLL